MTTATHAFRFFTTKPSKGGTYFKRGFRLFTRAGREVGTIAQDRESGLFAFFGVNGMCEEFKSLSEAETFAWERGL